MISPINCPYKELTAPPCWGCPNYIADTDQCMLNPAVYTHQTSAICSETYDDRLKRYEHDRAKLLELSKEALVDLILHKPTSY